MSSELTWWKNQIGREPMLTPAEEITLGTMVRQWYDWPDGPNAAPASIQRRGKRAKDRMVKANLRLATHFVTEKCGHYIRQGLPIEDLTSEAVLGLDKAVQKFDPARGFKFSTYAFWWIRQSVIRWAETGGKLIRTPADHAQRLRDAKKAAAILTHELGRQPTPAEIAQSCGLTVDRLECLIVTSYRPASLDLAICENGTLLDTHFFTANDHTETGDPERLNLAWKRLLRLPIDQRILIAALYGLYGLPVIDIQEVAEIAKVPKTEIIRMRNAAMVMLRREDRKYAQPSRAKPLPSLEHLRDALMGLLPPELLATQDVGCHGPEPPAARLIGGGDSSNLQSHDMGETGFQGNLLPDMATHDVADRPTQYIRRERLHVSDVPLQLEFCSQTEISTQPGSLCHVA